MKTHFKITEDHPIIQDILNSEEISDLDRLLAISELLNMEQRVKNGERIRGTYYDDGENDFPDNNPEDIDSWFIWEDSELGPDFWGDLHEKIYARNGSCGFEDLDDDDDTADGWDEWDNY